jgi:AcrR family transcriptional regulator
VTAGIATLPSRAWESNGQKVYLVLMLRDRLDTMEPNGVVASARERVRDAVRGEIVTAARAQLAAEGAGALSLRAVARELGMASSAVYRYFKSRDDLLTALIVEAYDSLGEAAEAAGAVDGSAFDRWRRVCHAVRNWALARPAEYTLIYGSPVPGYQAPELTVAPASRVLFVFARILTDAQSWGQLEERETLLPPSTESSVIALIDVALPGVAPENVGRGLVAWNQLYGHISFELYGQLFGVIHDTDSFFNFSVEAMGRFIGIRPT